VGKIATDKVYILDVNFYIEKYEGFTK